MTLFAHLSDLHATPPHWERPGEVTTKRALGLLSWQLRRRREHRPEILEALVRDLEETDPERVLVTGDVTNQGLPGELREGRLWLERLGGPERVFVVPGNHDLYVRGAGRDVARHWEPYLGPDRGGAPAELPVREAGGVAWIGLDSARATPTGRASGWLGPVRRLRLERTLRVLGRRGLARVVLVHHPPWTEGISRRRALTDAAQLRAVLARAGAELVLHGHVHRTVFGEVPGPIAPIPVVGVASGSAAGLRGEDRRARYHLLERRADGRFVCRARVLDPSGCRFTEGDRRLL